MADVISPNFGAGGGNGGGGGDGPSYGQLLIALEERDKIIMHQQQLLQDAANKIAAHKSANEMLQLTIMDLIRTLKVNQENLTGSMNNLHEILKALPKL